jgi:type II secretory pathway component PulF
MTKLQKNMEMVEILKQHDIALKKRNKLAVVIAAVSGFVMGVILTLLFPLITNWVSTFSVSLPHLHISNLTIDYSFVSWIVMAGVCIITALNAYEIALAKLASKETISI